jgi:hypothetical protein
VQTGIYLQVPIGSIAAGLPLLNLIPRINDLAGSLVFDQRIRLQDASLSFHIYYLTSCLLTMLWDGLLLIWRMIVDVEEAGDILVAVSQEALVFAGPQRGGLGSLNSLLFFLPLRSCSDLQRLAAARGGLARGDRAGSSWGGACAPSGVAEAGWDR